MYCASRENGLLPGRVVGARAVELAPDAGLVALLCWNACPLSFPAL